MLFDKLTASAFFRCLSEAAAAPHSRSKPQGQEDTRAAEDKTMRDAADDNDDDDATAGDADVSMRDSSTAPAREVAPGSEAARAMCEEALRNVAAVLRGPLSLREELETVQAAVDYVEANK